MAEGAVKVSLRDRQRYFAIARGSAFEADALLDACTAMRITDSSLLPQGQALLNEIAAMLTTLTDQAQQFKSKSKKIGQG